MRRFYFYQTFSRLKLPPKRKFAIISFCKFLKSKVFYRNRCIVIGYFNINSFRCVSIGFRRVSEGVKWAFLGVKHAT